MASHRLESMQALRKAASKARASRSSGVSAAPILVLDEKNALNRSSTSPSMSPADARIPCFACGRSPARSAVETRERYRLAFFMAWVGVIGLPSASTIKQASRLDASAPTAKERSCRLAASLSCTICQSSGSRMAGPGRLRPGEQCRPDRAGSAASGRGRHGKNVGAGAFTALAHNTQPVEFGPEQRDRAQFRIAFKINRTVAASGSLTISLQSLTS
jgi:hypothetical protein